MLMTKRIFDILFSIIGLIFFSPCFLLVSIFIKVDSKGPVFFLQERVGRNGMLFKIIKFRSMITDQNHNSTITTANDNRITTIGKIIRKLKIDELPELLNILIGNMSFVGPRPDVPGYADLLEGEDRLILKLKPSPFICIKNKSFETNKIIGFLIFFMCIALKKISKKILCGSPATMIIGLAFIY